MQACRKLTVVDRFSYLPVFIGAGVLPVLSLGALLVLVGKIRLVG